MDPFICTIIPFAGNFAPKGWAFCHGQLLLISQNTAVFSLLGTTYGGDGRTTFALPDLRGCAAKGVGEYGVGEYSGAGYGDEYPAAASGSNAHHSLTINYIIALQGIFPPRG